MYTKHGYYAARLLQAGGAVAVFALLSCEWGIGHLPVEVLLALVGYAYLGVPAALLEGAYPRWARILADLRSDKLWLAYSLILLLSLLATVGILLWPLTLPALMAGLSTRGRISNRKE